MKDIKTVEAPRRIGRDVVLLAVGYFGCGFSDQFISIHLVALAADGGIEQIVAAGLRVCCLPSAFSAACFRDLSPTASSRSICWRRCT